MVQVVLSFVTGWVVIRSTQTYFLAIPDNRWLGFIAWLAQAVVVATLTSSFGAVFNGATGLPTGAGSAVFSGTTCPDASFGDTACW